MDNRNETLAVLRGETIGMVSQESSSEEIFQNTVLRPILKTQNDLLLEVFKNYVAKYKNEFYSYQTQKKLDYIENSIQKDIKFRNSLKGIVIGLFTVEEYKTYIQNSSQLNKRMMNLVIQRVQDQVQLFELEA